MLRRSVLFTAPQRVEVVAEPLPPPEHGQVLVATEVSAISAGTEMLFYRWETPAQVAADGAVDATLAALGQEPPGHPLRYGYACVGRVVETCDVADVAWLGRLVFAFHPHTSHFWAAPAQLLRVPEAGTRRSSGALAQRGDGGQPGHGRAAGAGRACGRRRSRRGGPAHAGLLRLFPLTPSGGGGTAAGAAGTRLGVRR